MLKFFRNIRRRLLDSGSLRKYFVYAIGEILLVMIGILLALQVNNANERRKDLKQEKIYLNRLVSELKTDSLIFSKEIEINVNRNSIIKNFSDALNNKPSDDSLLIQSIHDYLKTSWLLPHFSPSTSTFDDLSSTGKLSIITNTNLRERIVQHYASYNDLNLAFVSNREWLVPVDVKFTTETDVLKFDVKTSFLFSNQSNHNLAQELRNEKEIYLRNAANHYWVNDYSIEALTKMVEQTSFLMKEINNDLDKH